MGLRLTLKPGDRVILNGCLVRNAGRNRMDLEVENRSDVLRGDEIIAESQAKTPMRRIAHAIQVALASREHRDDLLPRILRDLDQVEAVLNPDFGPSLQMARQRLGEGDFYAAIKSLGAAMAHEARLLGLDGRSDGPLPGRAVEAGGAR